MLSFLQKIYEAMDQNKSDNIVTDDFSKFWLTISTIEDNSSELIIQASGFLKSQVASPKDLFLDPSCSVYSSMTSQMS